MPFLPTLGRKDAPTMRALGSARPRMSSGSLTGRIGPGDVEALITHRYDPVTWSFRAIDAIALNQSKLRMVVREGDDPFEGEVVEQHPLLPVLNNRTNAYESAVAWRYRLSGQFLVSPKGAFVERVGTNAGRVAQLHLLMPQKVKPVPPEDPEAAEGYRAFVDHFEVDLGTGRKSKLPVEDVVWVRKPHPVWPYRSLTPLEQAGLAIDVTKLARVFVRNYLQTDGRGAALLTFAEEMEDEDLDELEARLNGGVGRAGRTSIVDQASDAELHEFGGNPGEWYTGAHDGARDEILLAFGVPLSVLGKATESTFSNADAEIEGFWRETMMPHLRFLSSALDPLLGGESERRIVGWDLSGIEVLQRDKRERDEFHLKEFEAGAITLDDYLDATGKPTIGGELGGTRFMNLSRVPLPSARQRSSRGGGTAGGDEGGGGSDPDPGTASLAPGGTKQDDGGDPWFEARKATAARFDRWERAVFDVATRWFQRTGQIVVARLTGKQGRRGTRHWDPVGTKQIDPERIFPRSRFGDEFVDDVREVLERLYDEVGSDIAAVAEGSFNLQDPAVTESLTNRTNRLRNVVDTTWDAVRDELIEGELAGESIDDLASRIDDVFDHASRVRARTIARTEVVSAANDASLHGARQSGGVTTKTWLTSRDSRVRGGDPEDSFSHLAMDGVTVPVGERFNVQGNLLDYPGDPVGHAANVINCRCTLVYGRGV